MDKPTKRKNFKLDSQANFEEIDHRLACGWHVDPMDSGQRKRYIKQIHPFEAQNPSIKAI